MLPCSGPDQTASFLTRSAHAALNENQISLSIMIDWGLGRLIIETFRDKFKSFVCKAGSETLIVNQSVLEMIFSLHCGALRPIYVLCHEAERDTGDTGDWGQEIAGAHYLQERSC